MGRHPADIGSAIAVLLALFAGVAALPSLPAELAIHFAADGSANTIVPSPVGILLIPLAAGGLFAYLRGGKFLPSLPERATPARGLALVAGTAYFQAALLALNLGYDVSPLVAVAPGILVILAASSIGRSRSLTTDT